MRLLFVSLSLVLLVLGAVVTRAQLPGGAGGFLIDPAGTLFWAGFASPPVGVACVFALDAASRARVAVAASQLALAFLLLYGGSVSYFYCAPKMSYIPALIASVVACAPAALHLTRGEGREHANLVLSGLGSLLGASLAYVAKGQPFPTFCGCFQALAGAGGCVASARPSGMGTMAQQASLAVGGVFLLSSAVSSGLMKDSTESLASIASSLSLLNALANARVTRADWLVALPPSSVPAGALPMTGRTRAQELQSIIDSAEKENEC